MSHAAVRLPALLLIGPPGSGKSPVGDALERRTGWVHFDLGAHLRAIVGGGDDHELSPAERDYVRGLLDAGALFPHEQFPLVARILTAFLRRHPQATGVVLNGLPRTIVQAEKIEESLEVRQIAFLDCPADIAAARVRLRRAGGTPDHAGRDDDEPDRLRRRLAVFECETKPLLEYYRARGVAVRILPVTIDADPEQVAATIAAHLT